MRQRVLLLWLGVLGGVSMQAQAQDSWSVLMCNPAPTCMGECRPAALVRPQAATIPMGCSPMGNYQSFEFARRSADSFNGKPPSLGGLNSFEYSFAEAERLRSLNDWYGAQQLYRDALSKASAMDEVLAVGEALVAGGDVQAGMSALARARDMSGSKAQLTMVGDAFSKAGRPDQARICYDRARDSSR